MRFWAIARYDLHLSDDEFYSLTPRQFDALMERNKACNSTNEFMFAQLTSWVANTGFKGTEKPTVAKDFMPSEWAKTARTSSTGKRKRMTRKRHREIADCVRSMFPNPRKV